MDEMKTYIARVAGLYGVEHQFVEVSYCIDGDGRECFTLSVSFRPARARKNARPRSDNGYGETLSEALESLQRSHRYRHSVGELPAYAQQPSSLSEARKEEDDAR
jgi:hypothetical protein